jgi:hypothetical protein
MYYAISGLDRLKKAPKFSHRKILKLYKKYGANWNDRDAEGKPLYFPAAWMPFVPASASMPQTYDNFYTPGGLSPAGAAGPAGATGAPALATPSAEVIPVYGSHPSTGAKGYWCFNKACRDAGKPASECLEAGYEFLPKTRTRIAGCYPIGSGIQGLGSPLDMLKTPEIITIGGALAGALAGGSLLKEYRIAGMVAGALIGFLATQGVAAKATATTKA